MNRFPVFFFFDTFLVSNFHENSAQLETKESEQDSERFRSPRPFF